jgi:hypothetical protein
LINNRFQQQYQKSTTRSPSIEGVTTKGEKAMKKMFVQPTDKMKKILDEEGLNIVWPEGEVDIESFAIDGYFYTGAGDWEKIVLIDLRKKEITDAEDADRAIAEELQSAYDNYDIGEEFSLHHNVRGAPDAETLWEDLKEAENRLEWFAELAYAVAYGRPIHKKVEAVEKVEIPLDKVQSIVRLLSIGHPAEEVFNHQERLELIDYLKEKINEVE